MTAIILEGTRKIGRGLQRQGHISRHGPERRVVGHADRHVCFRPRRALRPAASR